MFIQELIQSLQGAFDSSRCVHVVSADCRKKRWCGINVTPAPFPFCAGTWDKENESVLVFFWGWKEKEWLQYGRKVYDEYQILYHKFQIPVHIRLLFKIFFFLTVLISLSSLGFPGKKVVWSLLFTWLHVWNCNFNVFFPNHLYTKSFHEWLPYNFSTLIVNG